MLEFKAVQQPHLYIFGAGGTGGFALENLARLFAGRKHPITIDIYDGDTVELKNLKRQNFTPQDLDKNKATAMQQHLSQSVNQPPHFIIHDEYITNEDDLMSTLLTDTRDTETAIVVSAVDNIETRRLINQVVDNLTGALPIIAFDSGNDNQGGQVVAFSNEPVRYTDLITNEAIKLPNMLDLFPEINVINSDADKNPGLVMQCADESESKPQAMFNNVRNGEILANAIYQVVSTNQLPGNIWYSSMLTLTTTNEMKGGIPIGQTSTT